MIEVKLYGELAEKFGPSHQLEVVDTAEAVRGMCQLKGFREAVYSGSWQVIKGDLDQGRDLDAEGLLLPVKQDDTVHIMPAIEGAGSNGVGKVLMGAALIGAAFIPGVNALAVPYMVGAGASLAVSGVARMLGSVPGGNYSEQESPDQRPSFIFNGPVNTSTQGLPMPLIYGRMLVGSSVISAGMTSEELEE